MLTQEEIEQIKSDAWTGALTGYASLRYEYAQWFLLKDPKSDYEHYRMGITLLKQAAMQGLPSAQGELAFHLYYGKGIDKNENTALEWCEKALDYYSNPQWLRLLEVITKPHTNIMLSNAQMALYLAFLHHDTSNIEPRIDDNVILSDLLRYPTPGKMDVMEILGEWVANENTKVSLWPTERYGMVTERYIPNDIRSIIRSTYYIRTNAKGKIDRIARQPIVWDRYCFSAGSAPFPWGEIEPFLNDNWKGVTRGMMFCPNCGKLSHELKWINFQSKPDPNTGLSYIGHMSVCPECKQQVQFCCDKTCKKNTPIAVQEKCLWMKDHTKKHKPTLPDNEK